MANGNGKRQMWQCFNWANFVVTRPEVVNRCDSRFMTDFKTEFVTGHILITVFMTEFMMVFMKVSKVLDK